ncbi:Beta-glucosidase 44-like protein [Drosera capensis]
MADLNFDAYRFSISWSRIFPEGTGRINWEGVAYYNRLIDYMIDKGITPFANLYHYDLPEALEKKYLGLLSPQVVNDFADYADFCFATFGDRVKNWMTFNEPRVVAALGYDGGSFAPGRCSKAVGNCTAGDSGTEPYIVAHNLILSHAAAVQRYREKYQKEQEGKIGILLDFVWYEPLTRAKKDNYAAQRARDFHVGWFLHPIVYGEYPKTMQDIVQERLPKFTPEERKLVTGAFDYVGINQYTTFYMYDVPPPPPSAAPSYQQDWHCGFAFSKKGVPIGKQAHSSWLYQVPWGLYKAITYMKETYGNPTVFLSENGMDNPGNFTLHEELMDFDRIHYYRGYLRNLKKAIDDGANVVGYFAWSLLDNFEWLSGYTSRFGIVYVDYNDLKRYPKMSAYWFKNMLTRAQRLTLVVGLPNYLVAVPRWCTIVARVNQTHTQKKNKKKREQRVGGATSSSGEGCFSVEEQQFAFAWHSSSLFLEWQRSGSLFVSGKAAAVFFQWQSSGSVFSVAKQRQLALVAEPHLVFSCRAGSFSGKDSATVQKQGSVISSGSASVQWRFIFSGAVFQFCFGKLPKQISVFSAKASFSAFKLKIPKKQY